MAPASSASRVYPLPPPDTAPHPTHLHPSKKPSQTGQKQALGLPCIPGLADVAEWWTVPLSQEKGRDHSPRWRGCTHSQEADRLSSWDLVTQPQVLGLSNVLQVRDPQASPHRPESTGAPGPPAASFTALSSAKKLGSRTALFSIALALDSIAAPPGGAFTCLVSWDPGESREGLKFRESAERGFIRNPRITE